MEIELIEVRQIVEDADQPRKHHDEETMQGLADSIRQHGVLQRPDPGSGHRAGVSEQLPAGRDRDAERVPVGDRPQPHRHAGRAQQGRRALEGSHADRVVTIAVHRSAQSRSRKT